MRFVCALLVICSFSALSGCSRSGTEDRYEILIRHLSQRTQALSLEVLKAKNQCLSEENLLMHGEKLARPDLDPVADMASTIDNLLDGEDFIEEHNRRHPGEPWTNIKSVIVQICGDCREARAKRNREIAEEAKH